jgi:hypothetical protein
LPDWYPNFPYKWVGWSNWLSAVDKQVAAVKASSATNISAYELWNEPDWTSDTTNAGGFDAGWAPTYREVRAKDTKAPIQGPSYSAWNQSWMSTFLTDAKARTDRTLRPDPQVRVRPRMSAGGALMSDHAF